jgi:hypothetical protein
MTFEVKGRHYRLRRTWWGGWRIDKRDRMGAEIVHRGWWPLTDDGAIELTLAMREQEQVK